MRGKPFVLVCLSVIGIAASAATETINDLYPYDNTIEKGTEGFWDTTSHTGVSVSSETVALTDGFDSKEVDIVYVSLPSFSSEKVGMCINLR